MESADRRDEEEWTHTVRNKRHPTTLWQNQIGPVTPEHPAVVLAKMYAALWVAGRIDEIREADQDDD